MDLDGGWTASARAYIEFQDRGDPSRSMLLDAVMLRLCGDVAGRRILDLGCGEGRFSRMLAGRSASMVALDLVREMVMTARQRSATAAAYVEASAEALPMRDASFDLVVSYITLVDLPDFRLAIAEAARVLQPGGHFVVANLGFITATPDSSRFPRITGWVRDETGARMYRPIDRYMDERPQIYEWAGIKIRNWHRPLSWYIQAYLDSGLILRDFIEPMPPDDSLRSDPSLEDWYRVPEFTVMRWRKPG